jgi:hypothetical protein
MKKPHCDVCDKTPASLGTSTEVEFGGQKVTAHLSASKQGGTALELCRDCQARIVCELAHIYGLL